MFTCNLALQTLPMSMEPHVQSIEEEIEEFIFKAKA